MPETTHTTAHRGLIIGIIVAVVVAAAALTGFWWFLQVRAKQTIAIQYSHTNTANAVLREGNSAFAQAEAISGTSSPEVQAQRVALYQQALTEATDVKQKGHIQYKLAVATLKSGEYMKAVTMFKIIGTTTAYSIYDRAYAIQYLGSIFYQYHDPKITERIFADAPYSRLYVATSTTRSYLHLFEYAASFYPLAVSEGRIADAYTASLAALGDATTTEVVATRARYVGIVNNALQKLDADVARTKDDPNAKYDIPGALLRKAIVLGNLAQLKLRTPAEAEAAFQQAWDTQNILFKYPDPYFYFHYADYLAGEYGSAKTDEIKAQLTNLDGGTYSNISPVVNFLKNERSNVTNTKPHLVRLAQIDPKFKMYLESLGWQASDFSK